MKKIFTVLVVALAMSLAFTGCASKKAADSTKVYRVDIGAAVGSAIEVGEEAQKINISSFLDKAPAKGEIVRVTWTLSSDSDIDTLYVSLADDAEEYVLAHDISADSPIYVVAAMPVKEDLTGDVYIKLWSSDSAVCEPSYIDAK